MGEAERCHEISYIAYGELLTHGTVDEVIRQSNLTTWTVSGPDLHDLGDKLTGLSGVDMVAPFGASLHVSGRDREKMEASLKPLMADARLTWEPSEPSLEDVFIDLMGRSKDNFS
jgi:ABC-2 type transport system ATP-binding protein